ncbi:MAG TPA: hypothetical protein VNN79_15480 [Actinomycetota bacterium]|nr:hypothetical protein [Actinomycetota bacterium]
MKLYIEVLNLRRGGACWESDAASSDKIAIQDRYRALTRDQEQAARIVDRTGRNVMAEVNWP